MNGRLKTSSGFLRFNNEQVEIVRTKKKWYDGQLFVILCGFVTFYALMQTSQERNDRTLFILSSCLLGAYVVLSLFFLWEVLVKRKIDSVESIPVKDIRVIKIKPTLFNHRILKVYHRKDDLSRFMVRKTDVAISDFVAWVEEMRIPGEGK